MAGNGDRELLRKHKRGSMRKGTVGGYVLTDRDYGEVFKNKSTKNLVIVLGLSPLLVATVILWVMGLKIVALSLALAVLLISLLVLVIIRASV